MGTTSISPWGYFNFPLVFDAFYCIWVYFGVLGIRVVFPLRNTWGGKCVWAVWNTACTSISLGSSRIRHNMHWDVLKRPLRCTVRKNASRYNEIQLKRTSDSDSSLWSKYIQIQIKRGRPNISLYPHGSFTLKYNQTQHETQPRHSQGTASRVASGPALRVCLCRLAPKMYVVLLACIEVLSRNCYSMYFVYLRNQPAIQSNTLGYNDTP